MTKITCVSMSELIRAKDLIGPHKCSQAASDSDDEVLRPLALRPRLHPQSQLLAPQANPFSTPDAGDPSGNR